MDKPFYITTPIYYVNARPHLGHAYTTIVADVACRFHSMRGQETFFLTGTDEHGDKVVRSAKKEGLSPRTYVDQISGLFRSLWPELNIQYNYFVRTTDASHMSIVEEIMQKIHDAGDIYFSEYEGLVNMKGFTVLDASVSTQSVNWSTANARTMKQRRKSSKNPTIFLR